MVISKVMDASGDKYWKNRAILQTARLAVLLNILSLKFTNKNNGIASTLTIMSLIARWRIKRFITDLSFFALIITAMTSPLPRNPTTEATLRQRMIPILNPWSCVSIIPTCSWCESELLFENAISRDLSKTKRFLSRSRVFVRITYICVRIPSKLFGQTLVKNSNWCEIQG